MMRFSAKSLRFRCLPTMFIVGGLSLAACAQDAKDLYNQALVEGNSCKKMQLACQAAKLDKKKDYTELCDRFRTATNRSDEMFRPKVIDLINKNDLDAAKRTANQFVCSVELKQSLLSQIADAAPKPPAATPAPQQKADQSPALLAEANSAFSSGKFDAAAAAAQQVTDPNLKPLAQDIVSKINAYHVAVSAAKASEASKDYAGAIGNWQKAQGISSNGPDAPAANIARLEPLAHPVVAQNPTQTPPAQNPSAGREKPVAVAAAPTPKPQGPDINAQVARLMDDAGKAEHSNNLQAAVRAYDAVLRMQPENADATAKKTALLAKINSDPAEQAKSLTTAIRDFYSSKYADAGDSLQAYLDAPTAKSKGAAHFYLGATRLYEKILGSSGQKVETAIANPEVQRQFKEAHAAGYRPLEQFVSPVIMRAWQNTQ